MAIKCAHCKGKHDTVADVRACAEHHDPRLARSDKFNGEGIKPVTNAPLWPASEAQKDYVIGLQEERLLPPNWMTYDRATLDLLERNEVDAAIKSLKDLPRKPSMNQQREWAMPEGRYAIWADWTTRSDTSSDGEWWFFKVDKPTTGKWKGYTFIKRLIGAPGDYREVRLSQAERLRWLEAIEADPDKAMTDYGKQTMVCGRCSSPLTNEDSRARGIGPICLGKLGW